MRPVVSGEKKKEESAAHEKELERMCAMAKKGEAGNERRERRH